MELADAAEPANRGWFRAGDPRINRAGRPKGAQQAAQRARAGKPLCGRLMTLFVPEQDFQTYLTRRNGPWLTNLPDDFRIVAVDFDLERRGVVVTIHSEQFAAVPAGEPIPVLQACYNGLMWRRTRQ